MNTFNEQGNPIINNNKPSDSDRKMAALFHIIIFANCLLPLFFTGILILIIIKALKNDFSEYLNKQWREAVNFNISVLIYGVTFGLLCMIAIGIPLIIMLFFYSLIVPIIAAIKTLDGQEFKYPFIFRLV